MPLNSRLKREQWKMRDTNLDLNTFVFFTLILKERERNNKGEFKQQTYR